MRDLLGGKGCELAEMTSLGIPVPPGFTITTEAWRAYVDGGKKAPAALWPQVEAGLGRLEAAVGLRLGDPARPLLVSVRSGARVSMPGMMDTVLNLGSERPHGGGARPLDPERALRLGLLPPLPHHLRRRGAGHRAPAFDGPLDEAKARTGARSDAEVPAAGSPRAGGALQGAHPGEDRPRLPPGPARAAAPRRAGGVRLLVRQEGGGLPPHQPVVG